MQFCVKQVVLSCLVTFLKLCFISPLEYWLEWRVKSESFFLICWGSYRQLQGFSRINYRHVSAHLLCIISCVCKSNVCVCIFSWFEFWRFINVTIGDLVLFVSGVFNVLLSIPLICFWYWIHSVSLWSTWMRDFLSCHGKTSPSRPTTLVPRATFLISTDKSKTREKKGKIKRAQAVTLPSVQSRGFRLDPVESCSGLRGVSWPKTEQPQTHIELFNYVTEAETTVFRRSDCTQTNRGLRYVPELL